MRLVSVYKVPVAIERLHQLLNERPPEANISHKKMPTMKEHRRFVASKPYHKWYMIEAEDRWVGAIYLDHRNEIGIGIFKKYHGNAYGPTAIKMLMKKHEGPFLANIAMKNDVSMHVFEKLGFRPVQTTYVSE